MKSNWLNDKEFNSIYSKVPRLCIDLVINTEKGVLFTKRVIEPYKGKWHLPGGSVLLKEKIEDAAKRIAMNELNIKIEPVRILGIIEYLNEGNESRHSIGLAFLAKIKSGVINLNNQAESFIFSKNAPENTIFEQEEFLKRMRLI